MRAEAEPGSFAQEVTRLRTSRSLPKSKLEGISPSYMQKIENENVIPSNRMINAIAKALKCSEPETANLHEIANIQRKAAISVPQGQQQRLTLDDLAGVCRVSIGLSRTESFRALTLKAKKRAVIMGIGMTRLAKESTSLKELASRVPIDFLMLNPSALKREPDFSRKLSNFLQLPNFAASIHESFESIKRLCESWNSQKNVQNRMRFRVYDTIPTMSMVMIDPKQDHGEIELEFFIYQSGEFRPRFTVNKVNHNDSLFILLEEKFNHLWAISTIIT